MKVQNWRQVKETKPASGVTMRILCGTEEKAPNFVMRHFEFEQGAAMPFHAHPWEHEFFVLEGKGVIRTTGKEMPLAVGDSALVLPNEMHSVMNLNKEILRIICLVPLVDGKMPTAPGDEVTGMLSELVAYCGFDCSNCPAYKATHSDDAAEKKRIAEKWSKTTGKPMTPEDILCDGCRVPGGRLVAYCAECNIRTCAINKGVITCAHCPDMPACVKITTRKTRDMLIDLKKTLRV